jgi:poly(3-hydroxybutyrate) depolymerase
MYLRAVFCLFMSIGVMVNAQVINLRGTVLNNTGKPITNAIVTLAKQGLKDTTGSDGAYIISKNTSVVLPLLIPGKEDIFLEQGILAFSIPNPSPVKVEIFDVKGNLLKKSLQPNVPTGFYRYNIAQNAGTAKLLIVKASIGRNAVTFRYLPLQNGTYLADHSIGSRTPDGQNKLAVLAAISDTLKTTAAGYTAKVMPITSYDQMVNISLDSAGGTKPSAGCGKTTTLPKNSNQTVTINAGTAGDRSYIIRLPADYDQNHPYPLWFSIHCLNGTASGVATQSGYEYYGIWKFANPTGGKGTTIFCSPQGISNAWGQGAKDLAFFRAMIAKFESELCIDQSRIFAEGFSMGGSQSYALACAMPDTFRAVCMHSGGAMSGCDGSHRGPVPMFITHGTNDNVCTYPGSGVSQLKDLASRDGCTALDIPSVCKPTDGSGKIPVCADYQGCKEGFPCRACIFVGGHDYTPGGAASTWVDDSTWSYFKKFY